MIPINCEERNEGLGSTSLQIPRLHRDLIGNDDFNRNLGTTDWLINRRNSRLNKFRALVNNQFVRRTNEFR